MSECISTGTNIALYADDTKIWRKIVTWNDHIIIQNDIDALYEWSVKNKMKFHPQKCKALSVARSFRNHNIWELFPFHIYYYNLNGTDLDYVDSENDLGVVVNNLLNFRENILKLCSKASSRLGFVKRTLHFVKDQKKKRAFYLALVRSIFEHCSVIWRPSSSDMIQKVEGIQRRAVKWILSEQDHHYSDFEYIKRLKDLDMLPMEYKFIYTDLVQFHRIFYGHSVVKLPTYLEPLDNDDRNRFRSNVPPPNRYGQDTVASDDILDLGSMRNRRMDKSSLKCNIEATAPSFKNSFFFRAHILWNNLPVDVRELNMSTEFQIKLRHHLWDVILDPH